MHGPANLRPGHGRELSCSLDRKVKDEKKGIVAGKGRDHQPKLMFRPTA